ncbi:MAG TPA: anti-sigma factor [Ktedonobacteraceae bacterium]|nr:anti-sigma factor [Ktedonobacteraceae bacterium]
MTCEEFEELSGAFALDAVTPEERQAAREHLAGCVKCAHLYEELRSVVDLLPLSVTQVNPPPEAKDRLLATIRGEQDVPPLERGGQVRSARAIGARRWSRRLAGIAAAAVLMLALLGGMTAWNISLQHTVASLQQQNGALAQEVNGLRPEVAESYILTGRTPSTQNASGKLIYLPKQHLTILIMQGLPKLQAQQVYQGWLIQNGRTVNIGLLSVQNGIASVDFPGDISSYSAAAVSLERGPNGSKNAPAGPVVASGQLSHPVLVMV